MIPEQYKQALQLYISNQRKNIENQDVHPGYKAVLDMADLWLGAVCDVCKDTGYNVIKKYLPSKVEGKNDVAIYPEPCRCFRSARMKDIYDRMNKVNL